MEKAPMRQGPTEIPVVPPARARSESTARPARQPPSTRLMKLWVWPATSPCLPWCPPFATPDPQHISGWDGPQIALRPWRTRWRLGKTRDDADAVVDRVAVLSDVHGVLP